MEEMFTSPEQPEPQDNEFDPIDFPPNAPESEKFEGEHGANQQVSRYDRPIDNRPDHFGS